MPRPKERKRKGENKRREWLNKLDEIKRGYENVREEKEEKNQRRTKKDKQEETE